MQRLEENGCFLLFHLLLSRFLGVVFITILNLLKKLRTAKRIKQTDMMDSKENASKYSRIENGTTSLKVDQLEDFMDILEISPEEFFHMAYIKNSLSKFKADYRIAVRYNTSVEEKDSFVDKYFPKNTNIKSMSKLELCYYCMINSHFFTLRDDIVGLSPEEVRYILSLLRNNHYQLFYDYTIALNTMKFMNEEQIDKIIAAMIPIEDRDIRPSDLINTAFNLLTNAISYNIYNLNYRKASYYVAQAETLVNYTTGYYSKINLEYSKCMVNNFLFKDSTYIQKARNVIQTTRDIGDSFTANEMERELNILINDPKHYQNRHDFPSVPINE